MGKKKFDWPKASGVLLLILLTSGLAVSTVVTRMKTVESGYEISKIKKKNKKLSFKLKELKALRARHLSTRALGNMAKKFNLKTPSSKQVILISGQE